MFTSAMIEILQPGESRRAAWFYLLSKLFGGLVMGWIGLFAGPGTFIYAELAMRALFGLLGLSSLLNAISNLGKIGMKMAVVQISPRERPN
jgi:hypothetical protein